MRTSENMVGSSFLTLLIGHDEMDCPFQGWRFLPVPQKLMFHFVVSICLMVDNVPKESEGGFKAKKFAIDSDIFNLFSQ